MSEQVGFQFSRMRPELLGKGPEDWRAYVEVRASSIPELPTVISLGNRYLLSPGLHATHMFLLMDKCAPEPLTVERCLNCCALISFASDSQVIPVPRPIKFDATDVRRFSQTLRGTVFRTIDEYGDKLGDIAEVAEVYNQSGFTHPHSVFRILRPRLPKRGYWLYYPWPPSEQIFRGLSAYWLGVLSVLPPSRILNFWRCMEAVTTKAEREEIFTNLHLAKVAPIWTEATRIPILKYKTGNFDAVRLLRRAALQRRHDLIQKHGGAKEALDFIYWEGRGKAAHADKKSLEYDMAMFIGDQLRDAELLHYMARVAIETSWCRAA